MKNFVELGYVRRQRNCYAPEAIADFRQQVVRDLVPIVCEIKKNQAERIGVEDLKIYDDSLQFPDGNAIPQELMMRSWKPEERCIQRCRRRQRISSK